MRSSSPRRPWPSASSGPSARWPRRGWASRSPGADELAPRLASVLAVVYLIFNEGYSATAGEDLVRPALCEEAMRLGRVLAALVPARVRGARPAGPDGAAGVAAARPHRPGRRAGHRSSTRTAAAGTSCSIRRGLAGLARGRGARRRRGALRRAGRDRRRARQGPHGARRPTGRASPRSTPCWPGWPVAGRRAEPRGRRLDGRRPAAALELVDGLDEPALRRTTTCCRASAATCWPSWAAPPRRAPSSSAPPGSRPTSASATCCSPGPGSAGPHRTSAASPGSGTPPRRGSTTNLTTVCSTPAPALPGTLD